MSPVLACACPSHQSLSCGSEDVFLHRSPRRKKNRCSVLAETSTSASPIVGDPAVVNHKCAPGNLLTDDPTNFTIQCTAQGSPLHEACSVVETLHPGGMRISDCVRSFSPLFFPVEPSDTFFLPSCLAKGQGTAEVCNGVDAKPALASSVDLIMSGSVLQQRGSR